MRLRNGQRRNRTCRVVALASGKGGVGRTTIAVELARALARSGQSVLLVDLDPRGMALVTQLELPPPGPATPFEPADGLRSGVVATGIDGVSLLQLTGVDTLLCDGSSAAGGSPSYAEQSVFAKRLMQRLRGLGFDWVLLDLGGSHQSGLVATVVAADLPILVTTPEPPALVAAGQLLRACALACVRSHEAGYYAAPLLSHGSATPIEWDFIHLFRSVHSDQSRGVLVEACQQLSFGLVLNQVREGSEVEQAGALCHAWGMEIGVWPRALGSVQYEERRWFYLRRLAPMAQHVTSEAVSGDVDPIARRLLGLDWTEWHEPRACLPCVDPAEKPGVFLDVAGGNGQDVRQRYRRLWEAYRRDNGLVSYVMGPLARTRAVRLLERAYRTATVESRDGAPSTPESTPLPPAMVSDDPGKMLRQARMERSLGLRELSLRTRVGVRHIEALEAVRIRDLPSRVYLKAYLAEIAKTLELDPEVVVGHYVAFLDASER